MNHEKVSKAVEDICNLGCSRVENIIERLQNCEPLPQTEHLNDEERASVLKELCAIMAVYQRN